MNGFDSIRKLVSKGEIEATKKALNKLHKIFILKEFDPNPISLLEARVNKNERLIQLGVLELKNYDLESNRIIKAILEFTTQIEKGNDFTNIKPLQIIITRQDIGSKKIEIELEAFNEKHFLEIKTKWLYFAVFHNKGKIPIYKKSNIISYHEELHVFNIPTKNNSFLKAEISTSYESWSASFRNPKLKIENIQIFPHV